MEYSKLLTAFEARNRRIVEQFKRGVSISAIARKFKISRQRVQQIVYRVNGSR